MPQYAYIPTANAAQLATPEGYAVRTQQFKPTGETGLTSTQGDAICECLDIVCLEGDPFTQAQKDDILALGGEWFEDNEGYIAWFDTINQ